MFIQRRAAISGCVAVSLTAVGFMLTLEARQSQTAASPGSATHRTVVNQYCVSCHNDRLKSGGLALDAVAGQEVGRNPDI